MEPGWGRLQRIIVALVSLVALGSLSGGAGFYFHLNREEIRDARRLAAVARDEIAARLDGDLAEHRRAVATLGGVERLRRALLSGGPAEIAAANTALDLFRLNFGAEVCYLVDRHGVVVASTNRAAPDSFVGKSYAFRPYFTEALAGRPAVYAAQGVTSNRRGIFFGHPVRSAEARDPLGVAVIKFGAEGLERSFSPEYGDIAVIDGDGMVLLSNRPEWPLRPLWTATPELRRRWSESRQFGPGPWEPVGYRRRGDRAVSPAGAEYRLLAAPLAGFPGWQLALLLDESALARDAWRHTLLPGALILVLCLTLIGVGWFFVRWGEQEVALRREVERSREAVIAQLERSLSQVRTLEGLLPICANCKKIRDEDGAWQQLESYVHERTDARFTHGVCPDCRAELFPGVRPRTAADPPGKG